MPRYKDRNHELHARWKRHEADGRKALAAAPTDDRRFLVYEAVRLQCEHDHKAPWSIDQKLNDAPYRYTRDT
ncbi:MAG: hypothetical protein GY736_03520, partial [Sphingomonas sp.]|uniref:hypothetical protein n=1 Tax=Sphingomonas sp. TaxID=28214 RepID=UPI00258D9B0D